MVKGVYKHVLKVCARMLLKVCVLAVVGPSSPINTPGERCGGREKCVGRLQVKNNEGIVVKLLGNRQCNY